VGQINNSGRTPAQEAEIVKKKRSRDIWGAEILWEEDGQYLAFVR
jgi:hypothetical protein